MVCYLWRALSMKLSTASGAQPLRPRPRHLSSSLAPELGDVSSRKLARPLLTRSSCLALNVSGNISWASSVCHEPRIRSAIWNRVQSFSTRRHLLWQPFNPQVSASGPGFSCRRGRSLLKSGLDRTVEPGRPTFVTRHRCPRKGVTGMENDCTVRSR